jgi:hypothetical protein
MVAGRGLSTLACEPLFRGVSYKLVAGCPQNKEFKRENKDEVMPLILTLTIFYPFQRVTKSSHT